MGGLTVRAAIECALPHESLVYFGDGANLPYGPRPREEIVRFVDEAVGRLVERNGVKMIVIACNAATGAAIDHLRANYDIPIIGMEPAVKPAAQTTRTGTIGVLATAAAFKGSLYRTTSAEWKDKVRILETVGEGFVELVENDCENMSKAIETVRHAMEPMLAAGADRIVLGCTHYPFLAEQIGRVIDEFSARKPDVTEISAGAIPGVETDTKTGSAAAQIVDSAPAIARRVGQLLAALDLPADPTAVPNHLFLSFAGNDYIERLARKSAHVPRIVRNFE